MELCLTGDKKRSPLENTVTITIRIAGKWLYRMRRIMATICIALLAGSIGYKVVFGANGMKIWQSKRAEVRALEQEIERSKLEHEQLEYRVQGLQRGDPSMIEKEAREQLGYVKPGEVVLFEQRSKPAAKQAPVIAQNTDQK
jgi:cell division protein FtsB